MDVSAADQAALDELSAYTLTHPGRDFVHQHVVDAFGAQHPVRTSTGIGLAFALIGLYLHVERGCSGREVQQAHMRLARKRRLWPSFDPPTEAAPMTVHDVVAVPPGPDRDRAITAWAAAVWASWRASHADVAMLLDELGE
jgi:hypothetical protein